MAPGNSTDVSFESEKSRSFAYHPQTEENVWGPVRSATVWIVKGGLMEKRKTKSCFPLSHEPGCC
jgi:hypothetical protein